jgi:hypothetical protein
MRLHTHAFLELEDLWKSSMKEFQSATKRRPRKKS